MSSVEVTPSSPVTGPRAAGTPEPGPAPKKSRAVRNLIILIVVAVVAFFVWRIATANQEKNQQAAAKAAAAAADRAIPVQAAAVRQETIPIYLTGLGTVTAYYTVTVKSRVDGQLLRVNFKEGQDVHKGELMAQIDPAPYQALLDQAKGQLAKDQAQLNTAQAEYNRYKALFDQGVVSKESLDTQQANFGNYKGAIEADKAAIQSAQVNLDYTHITSPIDGRVGLRTVDPGNIVHASDTTGMFTLTQLHPIAVIFTLPEDELPQLLPKMRSAPGGGLPVEVWDRSDSTKLALGKLETIDNQIDTTTGTAKLKAVFANADNALFPNQFVNAHLVLEQRPNAIIAPAAALQHGSQGDFVFLIGADKKVKITPIHVNLTEGSNLIIGSGLNAGDAVVIDGAEKLRDGAKVDAKMVATGSQGGAKNPAKSGQPARGTSSGGKSTSGGSGVPAGQAQASPSSISPDGVGGGQSGSGQSGVGQGSSGQGK